MTESLDHVLWAADVGLEKKHVPPKYVRHNVHTESSNIVIVFNQNLSRTNFQNQKCKPPEVHGLTIMARIHMLATWPYMVSIVEPVL